MGITQPWNMVFLAGFIVYCATRGRFASRTKGNQLVERRVGARETLLLISVMISGLLFPVLYLFTTLFSFADYDLPEWVHWSGLACMLFSLWLFWRSHRDLGLNWSATLEIREGHEIVKSGVYRRVRHPMYTAIWMFCFSQALLLDNWLAGWTIVGSFTLLYFLRVSREEQMMLEMFGDEYQSYMDQTGRLFPGF